MTVTRTTTRVVALAAACLAGAAVAADPAAEPILERCLVSFIDEADVPAQEAGVLEELLVREGDAVQKDKPIARINDDQPQMERRKAQAEHDQAAAKAANTVDIRFAGKNKEVAQAIYEKNQKSNEASPGAVPEVEMRRLKLEWDKADLQIEQAKLEHQIAGLTADAKQVEVEAATVAIDRRRITSPLDGEVEKIDKHVGEWMQPGDRLAHVVRLDTLRVEGMVDAANWNPDEIEGREVTVEAKLERGRRETFTGRIASVSRVEQSGGEFLVRAEVANRRGPATEAGGGGWLLRAGKRVTMTIHTQRPPAQR